MLWTCTLNVNYSTKSQFYAWSVSLIPRFSPIPSFSSAAQLQKCLLISYPSRLKFNKRSSHFGLYIFLLVLPSQSYCFFIWQLRLRMEFCILKGKVKSNKLVNWTHIYCVPTMCQTWQDVVNKADKTSTLGTFMTQQGKHPFNQDS